MNALLETRSPGDSREALVDHAARKGFEIREKYGPQIGWNELLRVLEDRACVRYPSQIVFDQQPLLPGEFAHTAARGASSQEGFTIYVHPHFHAQLGKVPYLVMYHLVSINYGPFASADDAETFGSSALGLSKDEYYAALCGMADEIAAI